MSPLWRGPVVTAEDWRPGFFAWLRDDDVLGDPVPLVYALTAEGPAFRNEMAIEGHPLATGWAVLNDERQPLFVQPGTFWGGTTLHLAAAAGPSSATVDAVQSDDGLRAAIFLANETPGYVPEVTVRAIAQEVARLVDQAVAAAITQCGRELSRVPWDDDHLHPLARRWLDATWEQMQ